MVTKEALIVAIEDLYAAVVEGFDLYDGCSNPKLPEAPEEHYDKLARAIITYVKIEPRAEEAVSVLSRRLRDIEKTSFFRAHEPSTEIEASRQDPEGEAMFRQWWSKTYGRDGTPPPRSLAEGKRAWWDKQMAQYRAERAKRAR